MLYVSHIVVIVIVAVGTTHIDRGIVVIHVAHAHRIGVHAFVVWHGVVVAAHIRTSWHVAVAVVDAGVAGVT